MSERPWVVSRLGWSCLLGGGATSLALSPCVGINFVDHGGFVNPENTRKMDFPEATERLKRTVTDERIAAATGVSTNTIRRTRADPATRNYRPPPPGWELPLARLAEEKIAELLQLKRELEEMSALRERETQTGPATSATAGRRT